MRFNNYFCNSKNVIFKRIVSIFSIVSKGALFKRVASKRLASKRVLCKCNRAQIVGPAISKISAFAFLMIVASVFYLLFGVHSSGIQSSISISQHGSAEEFLLTALRLPVGDGRNVGDLLIADSSDDSEKVKEVLSKSFSKSGYAWKLYGFNLVMSEGDLQSAIDHAEILIPSFNGGFVKVSADVVPRTSTKSLLEVDVQ